MAAGNAAAVVVAFPDPYLEEEIRVAINKPTGDILDTDLVGVGFTELFVVDTLITDLTGLEYCTDLESLMVGMNDITDVAPLAGLVNLRSLGVSTTQVTDFTPLLGLTDLESLSIGMNPQVEDISWVAAFANLSELEAACCEIEDVGPLAGLTGLTSLLLQNNLISDISPLAGLTNLETLVLGWENLYGNRITEVSALAGLTSLRDLRLDNNSISEIDALAGLTNLRGLYLTGNLITDVAALVANPGIDGSSDTVALSGNPLSQDALCNDIPALQARGVSVYFDGTCGGTPPVITKQPGGGFVEVGQPHTFSIAVSSEKAAVGYWWRKDGVALAGLHQASWTIPSVSVEDAGVYTCLVADGSGTVISEGAYLNVVADGAMPAAGLSGFVILAAILGGAGVATSAPARRRCPIQTIHRTGRCKSAGICD